MTTIPPRIPPTGLFLPLMQQQSLRFLDFEAMNRQEHFHCINRLTVQDLQILRLSGLLISIGISPTLNERSLITTEFSATANS